MMFVGWSWLCVFVMFVGWSWPCVFVMFVGWSWPCVFVMFVGWSWPCVFVMFIGWSWPCVFVMFVGWSWPWRHGKRQESSTVCDAMTRWAFPSVGHAGQCHYMTLSVYGLWPGQCMNYDLPASHWPMGSCVRACQPANECAEWVDCAGIIWESVMRLITVQATT